ncbi:MAG: preprotein translocase subunit SecE [Candidatus Spechtbacteria bacterium SB0662_bin_43]|uniref:Protein translocase subunit SecE n=1 Tax=Candidatus Spechtbacteria bacterium SB0662_bin_43 TaxID=2604897 RepID=A0A845D982_9BACT|nr:preprotein translocase subunit SecE [Candidatus Spechtbacteria bacterium SB0662_bin_43]
MINPIIFLKEVQTEMKKVTWLTRNEVLNYAVLIIVISIITGIYLGVLDLAFSWFIQNIL